MLSPSAPVTVPRKRVQVAEVVDGEAVDPVHPEEVAGDFLRSLCEGYQKHFGEIELNDPAWWGVWRQTEYWSTIEGRRIHPGHASVVMAMALRSAEIKKPMGLVVDMLHKHMRRHYNEVIDVTQPPQW